MCCQAHLSLMLVVLWPLELTHNFTVQLSQGHLGYSNMFFKDLYNFYAHCIIYLCTCSSLLLTFMVIRSICTARDACMENMLALDY